MSESPQTNRFSAGEALLLKKDSISKLPPIVKEIVEAQKKESKHNPHLVVSVADMNNQNGKDFLDCNPEKNALHIGLHWRF